ncbi:MAG: undecaprenyldiphospho-muramoylpentapeptide beta-N-acetylglucosaminyltransferase [Bacillota bacterium]|nr:undecaprenyldiphospho-muramoylpentapeptide beta-N-acetylglucosaminyltransferase [Bacillota bacterium]
MKQLKVLLAGGGTGGHVNPALAIAGFIRQRKPGSDIRFVGTEQGIESTLVPKAGYPLYKIEVYGLKRRLTYKNIKTAVTAISALSKSKEIIKEFKPDIVIGTGGYVSFPVLYMAAKMGIPTAIHEQNAFPGVTSRILSKHVDRVMVSFPDSGKYFPKKTNITLVGNPIRDEFLYLSKQEARKSLGIAADEKYIVSVGGSMGARDFNNAIIDFIALHSKKEKYRHTHACGERGFKWVPEKLKEKGIDLKKYPNLDIREYIYNMPTVLAAADIVISRSGAITLGELAALGKPSILIPSPNVTHNHQYFNAMSFVSEDAAVMIEEKDLTGEKLKKTADELLNNKSILDSISKNAQKIAILDSTQKIYNTIFELMADKK